MQTREKEQGRAGRGHDRGHDRGIVCGVANSSPSSPPALLRPATSPMLAPPKAGKRVDARVEQAARDAEQVKFARKVVRRAAQLEEQSALENWVFSKRSCTLPPGKYVLGDSILPDDVHDLVWFGWWKHGAGADGCFMNAATNRYFCVLGGQGEYVRQRRGRMDVAYSFDKTVMLASAALVAAHEGYETLRFKRPVTITKHKNGGFIIQDDKGVQLAALNVLGSQLGSAVAGPT
jgi:hypothetical protein